MALIDTLIAFIPMLGSLIFIHELGHFLVAKACGVRVLTFSLGFGPAIGFGNYRLRWERGGTEYLIAWVPLGGYVKMLGENLELQGEEPEPGSIDARPDEYLNEKNMWQKLAISFAGPAMNLAFPIVVLVAWLMIGMPRESSVIGTVEPASPAALAGLSAGDRLLSINGSPMRFWSDVDSAVRSATDGALAIEAERDGSNFSVEVPIHALSGMSDAGQVEARGWIGIHNERMQPLVAVPDPNSQAARAGLLSGDLIVKVNDAETLDWNALADAIATHGTQPMTVAVLRGADAVEPIPFTLPPAAQLEELGLLPAPVLIAGVEKGSAAFDAGLLPGDLLLAVDGRLVGSFESFRETVLASEGRELELTYARKGEVLKVALAPRLKSMELGVANMKHDVYLVGIRPHTGALQGEYEVEQYANPFAALPRATELTLELTRSFLKGLGTMFSGGVGLESLAGPIGIAQIARHSLDLGWGSYFFMMMMISINLGILNLLPIPVLDGGQALIYIVEGVKRSPLSLRSREVIQSVGLVMVLMLMTVAIGNDIMRSWSTWLGWLRGEP